MSIASDTQHIRACIQACAASKDGRGRWRPLQELRAAFRPQVQVRSSEAIATATTNAACRFGVWLAAQGLQS